MPINDNYITKYNKLHKSIYSIDKNIITKHLKQYLYSKKN